MEKKDKVKVKVKFSISLTKTYDTNDIEGFLELSHIDYNNADLKVILYSMIVEDVTNAISDGRGHFEIIG